MGRRHRKSKKAGKERRRGAWALLGNTKKGPVFFTGEKA